MRTDVLASLKLGVRLAREDTESVGTEVVTLTKFGQMLKLFAYQIRYAPEPG